MMNLTPRSLIFHKRSSLKELRCEVVLIGLSLAWPTVANGRGQWSVEQAREYQTASAQLHGLTHELAHEQDQDGDALAQKIQQAQSEFDRLHEQLQAAQQSPLRISLILRLLGFALIVVGVIVHYADRFRGPA
jgi:uncharacterized protein HemX